MQVSVEIPVELQAIAIARDVVSRVVADSASSEERIEEARLLTSAVVTRAMRRAEPDAGGSIGLVVDVSSDRLRVEVTDQSPQLGPSPQGEPSEKEGGWGLIFVAELSDSWGAEPDSVWFELSLEPDGRRSVCARARKGRSPGRHRRQEIRGGQSLTAMAFRCDDCVEWTDYVALPTSPSRVMCLTCGCLPPPEDHGRADYLSTGLDDASAHNRCEGWSPNARSACPALR